MMRVLFIVACLVGAVVAAYYGQPYVEHNADATLVIITVLSVFAGFLVAIITIIGDPSMMPHGSWRSAEVQRGNVESRLIRHTWLFILYLVGIGLLFIGTLLHKSPNASPELKKWVEYLYLFFGVFAFLLTAALPGSLLKLQMRRLDSEIERRRRDANIPEENS
jgi:hypothetical protein